MNYRLATILATEDLGASGTKVIDLTMSDILSRIQIIHGAINGDPGQDQHPAANLPKIEIVDGSDVLYSLTGKCAQARDFYDRPRPLGTNVTALIGAMQEVTIDLNFGRYLYDPILAFDPKKFTNPQLKITFNRALANTSCTTAYTTVKADQFDEKVPTPTGFLMNKEHYIYPPTANGYEYIDLPRDHPIRSMGIQMLRAGMNPLALFSEARLSEDNDKRVPFTIGQASAKIIHYRDYPHILQFLNMFTHDTDLTIYVDPGVVHSVTGATTDGVQHFAGVDSGGGTIIVRSEGVAKAFTGQVMGMLPHAVWHFPFGLQDQIDDWYDVRKLGSVVLRVKAGAAALATDTFRVLLQQYRAY